MALGALPYKGVIATRGLDGNGVPRLGLVIRDANNVNKGVAVVYVGDDFSLEDIRQAIARQVTRQMVIDAGGFANLIDAIINGGGILPAVLS